MGKLIYRIAIFVVVFAMSSSCKKKFDLPATPTPPALNGYIKIDSIRKIYKSYYISAVPSPNKFYKFNGDVNLECTVTADETSGNIYKTVYVEDATGGLPIKLMNKGGLYVGDKIRINLNGVILDDYGDMVQLDSVDIEKRVVKISSGNPIVPTKVTFNQLLAFNSSGHTPYQGRLVVVDSVSFMPESKNKPFADIVGRYSIDRLLTNASGTTAVAVRTSGYANFAGNITPCGKGTMTLIVGQYNTDLQFTIRNYNEIKLLNAGCPITIADFDGSTFMNSGWFNYRVGGTIDWVAGNYNGKKYAEISNYVGGSNNSCETWLISPSMDLSGTPNPYFSFESAYNYTGPTLQVYISQNYVSGNPTTATWIQLNPNLSTGGYNWVNSGMMSLFSFKTNNVHIAFRYTGTAIDGSTWELDNIAVFGELP